VFSVADTGPGIEPEDLEHIFDRFWQARRSRAAGRGLGLGLAIVKGIVQAHGGRVWAESQPGEGTTIRFTLPAATDNSTQAA
jgi:signal transduction histidine kinase